MKKIMRKLGLTLIMGLMLLSIMTPIFAIGKKITLHYKRPDNNYEGWNLWVWADGKDGKEVEFSSEDDYGKIAIIEIEETEKVGFIVKKKEDGNLWAAKDVDTDRFIEEFKDDNTAEVWLMADDPEVSYTKLDGKVQDKFKDVQISDLKVIKFITSTPFTKDEFSKINVNGYTIDKVVEATKTSAFIYLKEELDLTKEVKINFDRYGEKTARIGSVLHSDTFNKKYATDEPLGYNYSQDKTEFKLWAPTASKVSLHLEDYQSVMDRNDKGVWSTTVRGDHLNQKYTYELEFADGTKNTSVDPYSYAVTANGLETVIVTEKELSPENWDATKRMESFGKNTEAIIYEAHIRDMTIHPDNGIENKGKFLGLSEKGTKTKDGNLSGLDYIKSLGVTHVQFLPIYDFASIDETADLGYGKVYNWGYDPLNYNVPEGTYSSDPTNPVLRAKELKTLIQALHDEGLYVIMDVVYNHVSDVNRSAFHKTVPGYYFRYDDQGKLLNGTGVGNETASEQPMFRRYMVESTKYWIEKYNLDGFRFDLMGIHDVETMKQIREEINKIDPSIIILGEGWDMGTHPSNLKSNQKNANKLPEISYFNDLFRDAVKGSVFEASDGGFVNGKFSQESVIGPNMLGANDIDKMKGNYVNANQVVQYVEAHDNLTLYDKLLASKPDDSEEIREQRHNLATSMVLLSQGMPFIHAGQEILRTKGGDHNSYISSDDVNAFDYDRQTKYPQSLELFKSLVNLRKDEKLLHLDNYEDIASRTKQTRFEDNTILYSLDGDGKTLTFIFNGNETESKIPLSSGKYTQLFNSVDNSEKELEVNNELVMAPLSSIVLKQESDSEPIKQEKPETTTPKDKPEEKAAEKTETNKSDNTLLFIGSALVVGMLAGAIWFSLNRKKK